MEKRARGKARETAQNDLDYTPEQDGLEEPRAGHGTDTTAVATIERVDAPAHAETYGKLTTPFDVTFKDLRGGVELEYITGEQAVTRLNETLGFMAWSFRILEHGIHPEADECWVLGELTVDLDGKTVSRQQFGSQKIKRSRSSGTPLDIGFDLKGAATDALKKCASLVGVALYLWKKEPPAALAGAGSPAWAYTNGSAGANGTNGFHVVGGTGGPGGVDPEALYCEECGEPLTETRFKDGTNWAPAQLAVFGRRKHSRILCMMHYREANQAKRRAEEALQQVPF